MAAVVQPPAPIRWALTTLAVAALATAHFGVPVGSFSLGLSMPAAFALLAVLWHIGQLELDTTALPLYGGLAASAGASYLLNANLADSATSIHSMLLLLVLYLPFVFRFQCGPARVPYWRWTMRMLGDVLLALAVAGIVQFALQFVMRAPWLFDASLLMPAQVRAQGIYNTAIPVGSHFKSNGFFFREPSGFSFATALGLVLELVLFRRRLRMAAFGAALALSYSGTGLLALAIGMLLPLRLSTLSRLFFGTCLLVGTNALSGDPLNLAFTLSRVHEFGAAGSSAYARYVAPLVLVDAQMSVSDWSTWLGNGPGTILKLASRFEAHDPTWAKLLLEYGLAGFVLCTGLVGYRVTTAPAPLPIKAVLFANWLVMGGHLLTPDNVFLMFLALAVWPADPPPRSES